MFGADKMSEVESFQKVPFGLPLESSQKSKLFLFRFPKDFDLSSLDNASLTLPMKEEEDNVNIKIGESEYKLRYDQDQLSTTIRPLISNSNSTTIGDKFAASFTLTRNISLNSHDNSPPITSYKKVPQVEGLAVRHLPFGSTTQLQDLHQRILERSSQRHKRESLEGEGQSHEREKDREKVKKRKSEIKESTSVVEVETPSSKSKKSKKNKKSHE